MIDERIASIEGKIQASQQIPEETRAELLKLVSALKSEISALPETRQEDAQSIATFADALTGEATRTEKKEPLVSAALDGLNASVEELETSHPELTAVVNRLAAVLSNMGI